MARAVFLSPVVGEHHGHGVGRHAGEPADEVDGRSEPGFVQEHLHHVMNLCLSGALVGSVNCRREQVGAGKSSKLAPVLAVWRGGQALVSSARENLIREFPRPG